MEGDQRLRRVVRKLQRLEDGLKLGASHFYATSDEATFEELAGRFDLILSTVSAPLAPPSTTPPGPART